MVFCVFRNSWSDLVFFLILFKGSFLFQSKMNMPESQRGT